MKLIVYDCEILNAIPDSITKLAPLEGIKYCQGWGDHAGMGISVVCAYIWGEGYRVFLHDNLSELLALAMMPDNIMVGFNNHAFDDKLIRGQMSGEGLNFAASSWDLAREVRRAKGMNPDAPGGGTGGLDGLARANFLSGKKSTANAPVDWQRGLWGKVIDQCLLDVMLTKRLVELALDYRLRDTESGRKLAIDITALKPAVDQVEA